MSKKEHDGITRLLDIMKTLRNPDGGCAWDLAQDFSTIAPHTIEEAYEVADAIERDNMDDLEDELGDLLLQVVFHAQMASEKNIFDFDSIAHRIADKMLHRHPHVFGDDKANTPEDVLNRIWEDQKDKEKKRSTSTSILDDVTKALPALMRAQKLHKRAARTGFEWPDLNGVLDKVEEEIHELRTALSTKSKEDIHEEVGDLLSAVTNLGRMAGVDCETALRDSNHKFERRFKGVEKEVKKSGKEMTSYTLEELESLWIKEKIKEKTKKTAA